MGNVTDDGTKMGFADVTDPFFVIETGCIIWFTFELVIR